MNIRIGEDGKVWVIEPVNSLLPMREATSQDKALYSDEIDALSGEMADVSKMPVRFRSVVRALVKTINLRFPAGQKITEVELKAAIKEEVLK